MLVIYGEASYKDNSALQHVRNLRKEIPQVCLLSRITLDSEGEKILNTLIEELILFDPASIRDDDKKLDRAEILDILKEHGDIKAIFISHECDDYMIDELLAAVSELDVKPILISERYIDRAIDLFIGNDEEILKTKTHIAISDIESCKSTDDILKYLISHHCFGPDFEKPVLALFNCSNS